MARHCTVPAAMSVTVLLFAVLRESRGASSLNVDLQAGETVSALYARLFPDLVDGGRRLPVMYAVGQSYVEKDHLLADGDEVAFIPPLGGGAPDPRVGLTTEPLRIEPLLEFVGGPGRGGICTFTGTVRDNFEGKAVIRLEYEAYETMALSEMSKLCDEVEEKWPGVAIAMHHRLGTLEIGEAAVIVAAGAPHRGAAFEACRHGIDSLKDRVTIWKKEVYTDGAPGWKANE